jgi:2-polyprenyl-6-methoxyphenol hydroxylase-like FAD-dependent oxidoreductase
MHRAVIGAGIAGISVTHALRRIGIAVDLFEQAPEARSTGYQLNVWPNGKYALGRSGGLRCLMGEHHSIEATCTRHCFKDSWVILRSAAARSKWSLTIPRAPKSACIFPAATLANSISPSGRTGVAGGERVAAYSNRFMHA